MEKIECEICGRPITKSYKIEVEGTIVEVCERCVKYGKLVETPEEKRVTRPLPRIRKEGIEEELVLVENYGKIIKEAREKLGLERKELGKKIGEKESVLKKVEEEKMRPDEKLVRKLEKTLRVKLLTKVESSKVKRERKEAKLTLGDVIVLRSE